MAFSETCSVCGQEVRRGVRHGREAYWHREDVDHEPIFGAQMTPEKWEAMRDVLTARDEAEEVDETIPGVESPCRPIATDDLEPRSGIRQVANLVAKNGWELRRLTHARGPYMGSKGKCLSVSDSIVLGARGPERLDGGVPVVVASWRDGKFDFAHTGILKDGRVSIAKVDATTMKNWIKGL